MGSAGSVVGIEAGIVGEVGGDGIAQVLHEVDKLVGHRLLPTIVVCSRSPGPDSWLVGQPCIDPSCSQYTWAKLVGGQVLQVLPYRAFCDTQSRIHLVVVGIGVFACIGVGGNDAIPHVQVVVGGNVGVVLKDTGSCPGS